MNGDAGKNGRGSKKDPRPLDQQPVGELIFRHKMANAAIKFVLAEGDPNGVVEKYREQAKKINDALKAKMAEERDGPKPEAIDIGLKPARMVGRVGKDKVNNSEVKDG